MKIPPEWLDAAQTFVIGLTPGAIGSAVGLAHEKGLSWAERFTQLAAGTVAKKTPQARRSSGVFTLRRPTDANHART